jgi:uncharacterized YigZ family protein
VVAAGGDGYLSIAGHGSAEFVERKSRFIGQAFTASSEEEASLAVGRVRKAYPDASHHCYAYVVGLSGQWQKASDDGEPSGTAGRPILDVLLRQGVVNAVVVVTRYFGGVLLGTGGLVRAYSHTAKLAVEAAGVARSVLCVRFTFAADYGLYGKAQRELESRSIPVEGAEFAADVVVTCRATADMATAFGLWLADASAGHAELAVLGELYAPVNDAGVLL